MKRFGSNQFDSDLKFRKHAELLLRKRQRLAMREAIRNAYEALPYEQQPHEYLDDLRDRIRKTAVELQNMAGN